MKKFPDCENPKKMFNSQYFPDPDFADFTDSDHDQWKLLDEILEISSTHDDGSEMLNVNNIKKEVDEDVFQDQTGCTLIQIKQEVDSFKEGCGEPFDDSTTIDVPIYTSIPANHCSPFQVSSIMASVPHPTPDFATLEHISPPEQHLGRLVSSPLPLPDSTGSPENVQKKRSRRKSPHKNLKKMLPVKSKNRNSKTPLYLRDPSKCESVRERKQVERAKNTKIYHERVKEKILVAQEVFKLLASNDRKAFDNLRDTLMKKDDLYKKAKNYYPLFG